MGIKTADVDAAAKAIEASGGGIVKGPYDDAHERRAVVYDNKGNGLVFYSPLAGKNRHLLGRQTAWDRRVPQFGWAVCSPVFW